MAWDGWGSQQKLVPIIHTRLERREYSLPLSWVSKIASVLILITGSLPTYVVPSTALLLILKMGHPRPLFHLFSVFSNKPNKCTQQQMNVMNYPFCMRCRDSNARPLDCQSPPIISRPGPVGQWCTLLQTSFTVQGTSGPCDNVSKLSESLSILNTFVHSLLLNIWVKKHLQFGFKFVFLFTFWKRPFDVNDFQRRRQPKSK